MLWERVCSMRMIRAAVLSLLLTVPVGAQHRADFSGTWILAANRIESPLLTNGHFAPDSVTLEIAQTENEVRIDTVRDGAREVRHYPFESTDLPQAVGTSGRFGAVSESDEYVPDAQRGVGTAGRNGRLVSLDGNRLETITPHKINGMAVTTIERRTLSENGREMIVVTQLMVHHGYEGAGANVSNVSSPVRDVYVRRAY